MPKIGDKIKIIANLIGHNFPIGSKHTIKIISEYGVSPDGNYYLTQSEFEVVDDNFSLETLEKSEVDILAELNKEKYILYFLEKNDLSQCQSSDIFADYLIQLFESKNPNKRNELAKFMNGLVNSYTIEKIKNVEEILEEVPFGAAGQ